MALVINHCIVNPLSGPNGYWLMDGMLALAYQSSTVPATCSPATNNIFTVEINGTGSTSFTYDQPWNVCPIGTYNKILLLAGTYHVKITQVSTGEFNEFDIVLIDPPSVLTYTTQGIQPASCGNTGIGTAQLSGGWPGKTYAWTLYQGLAITPGFLLQSGNTSTGALTFPGLAAGSYTLVLKHNETCLGATRFWELRSVFNITSQSAPVTSVIAPLNGCGSSGSITLTPTSGTAPYTYLWTGPSGFSSTQQNLTGLTAGTYSVIITDSFGCTGTNSSIITEIPSDISVSIAQIGPTCEGNNTDAVLTANPTGGTAYTYLWTGPGGFTGTTKSIGPLSPGIYTVVVTDPSCGTGTASKTIIARTDCDDICYKLSLCTNPGIYHVVSTDLSDLVGKVIKGVQIQDVTSIEPDQCWLVSETSCCPGIECLEPSCPAVPCVEGNTNLTIGETVTTEGYETSASTNLIVNGDFTVSGGDLIIHGYLIVNGNLDVTGDVIIDGYLHVTGDTQITGNVSTGCYLTAQGDTGILGNVTVPGVINWSVANVQGDITAGSIITIELVYEGTIETSCNILVSGITSGTGDISTMGYMETGELFITGNITTGTYLEITGEFLITGSVNITCDFTAAIEGEITGDTFVRGNIITEQSLTVNTLTCDSDVNIGGEFHVSGISSIKSNLTVASDAVFLDTAVVRCDVSVQGLLNVTDFTAKSITSPEVVSTGNIDVECLADITNSLSVQGNFTTGELTSIGEVLVEGDVLTNCNFTAQNLSVQGDFTVKGVVSVPGDFNVSGTITILNQILTCPCSPCACESKIFLEYSTIFSDCEYCLDSIIVCEVPEIPIVIPAPVRINFQIKESKCDINVIQRFAEGFWTKLKQIKFGVTDCYTHDLTRLWLDKQISDLADLNDLNIPCVGMRSTNCLFLPKTTCSLCPDSANGTVIIGITAEAISAGDVVMIGANGRMYKNNPSDDSTYQRAVGLARYTVSANSNIRILVKGEFIKLNWGLSTGSIYYAGPAGSITSSIPASNLSQMVGVAKNTNTLIVDLKQPIIIS